MIVDSSALVAISRREPEAAAFASTIADADRPRISAANLLESAIVIDGARDPIASRRFDDLVSELRLGVESVTAEHVTIARAAYRDFGKGSGHPAGLNFGDCFAYALAKTTGEQLLYKGDDFVHTDVESALGPND